jgi:signal transduction histidine kinase
MSAGLAHEFKNALATLHGYAQLLQNESLGAEARASSAAALLQEVRGLSEMVTSFLNFARPNPPDFGDVSLKELLDHGAADLRRLYEGRGVALDIAGEFPEVRADERMLGRALLNLLRNAAEAVPEDAAVKLVSVRGSVERDDSGRAWVRLEVEDTGGRESSSPSSRPSPKGTASASRSRTASPPTTAARSPPPTPSRAAPSSRSVSPPDVTPRGLF